MKLDQKAVDDLIARGAIVGKSAAETIAEREAAASVALDGETCSEPTMVEPAIAIAQGTLIIMVPFASKSESNLREWKGRSRRSGQAWKAVRLAVGRHLDLLFSAAGHYADDGALMVRFTRHGSRRMDKSNLNAAMKGVEDAIAYLLGADDGDPRWHSSFDQIPGGSVGVRIEISKM